jgi:hypothetical protein
VWWFFKFEEPTWPNIFSNKEPANIGIWPMGVLITNIFTIVKHNGTAGFGGLNLFS